MSKEGERFARGAGPEECMQNESGDCMCGLSQWAGDLSGCLKGVLMKAEL
jgi:hypothetical protein